MKKKINRCQQHVDINQTLAGPTGFICKKCRHRLTLSEISGFFWTDPELVTELIAWVAQTHRDLLTK